jgi:hypothetical protein
MSDYEKRVNELLSDAKQLMYNASKAPETSKKYWIKKAQEKAFDAYAVPTDFKYEFVMPEWGTYGT